MFNVQIVADSIMPMNHRATSTLVTFPRSILAEFNTHRVLTRNSASSRAIPTRRMLQMVRDTPFIPMRWMKDHPGMQGTEYVTDQKVINLRTASWLKARDLALQQAGELYSEIRLYRKGSLDALDMGELAPDGEPITKQVINRLLEPFMWHTVLFTATEWENFFALRDHPAADIHMQHIAHMMLEALNGSNPKRLKAGEWHMPFGDQIIDDEVIKLVKSDEVKGSLWDDAVLPRFLKISTARCARTSYLTFDQTPVKHDYAKDILQTDSLITNGHMSPLEHCCRAMSEEEYYGSISGQGFRNQDDIMVDWADVPEVMKKNMDTTMSYIEKEYGTPVRLIHEQALSHNDPRFGWCGNFRGFIQYRKTIPNENRTDPRLIKHTY